MSKGWSNIYAIRESKVSPFVHSISLAIDVHWTRSRMFNPVLVCEFKILVQILCALWRRVTVVVEGNRLQIGSTSAYQHARTLMIYFVHLDVISGVKGSIDDLRKMKLLHWSSDLLGPMRSSLIKFVLRTSEQIIRIVKGVIRMRATLWKRTRTEWCSE